MARTAPDRRLRKTYGLMTVLFALSCIVAFGCGVVFVAQTLLDRLFVDHPPPTSILNTHVSLWKGGIAAAAVAVVLAVALAVMDRILDH